MPPARLFLLLAGAAISAIALAQDKAAGDRPESILPPGFGQPPSPPAPATTAPSATSSEAVTGTAPAATAPGEDGGVEISDSLAIADEPPPPPPPPVEMPDWAKRDPRLVGVLDPHALALGDHPWGATDGRLLEGLMRRLRRPTASRWAHISLRNMLLAKAEAPFAVGPVDWAAERSWLLLKMGEADAARLLVSAIDVDQFTPKMVQVAAQSALANGDPAGLCAIETLLPAVEPRVAPLVSAMCASLAGSPETAAADIDQARRRGRVRGIDLTLADKLVGAGADTARAVTIEWQPVDRLNSWRFGLAVATGMMPPERLVSGASPQVRAWLARSPMLSVAERLPSARDAAAMGVFSAQALTDLYALAYDRTDPDELGQSDAWLVRMAYAGKDQETRLEAMRKLWNAARSDNDRVAAQLLTARAAVLVAPDAALQDDAPRLVAALLAAGFDRQAARWARVMAAMDDGPSDRLFAMLALGAPGQGVTIDYGRLVDFAKRDISENHHRTAMLVGALVGLGRLDNRSAGKLDARFDLGLARQTTFTRLIDGASRRRQPGTAMILTGSATQGASWNAVPAIYLFHAINALHRTGQDWPARMIAAEALART